jgi:hypothetical protein
VALSSGHQLIYVTEVPNRLLLILELLFELLLDLLIIVPLFIFILFRSDRGCLFWGLLLRLFALVLL